MKSSSTDTKSELEASQETLVFLGRRKKVSTPSGLLSLGFMLTCPLFVIFLYFGSSLEETAHGLASYGVPEFFLQYTPSPTLKSLIGYTGWLPSYIPCSPAKRLLHRPPPGGNTLVYRFNGLNSWIVTMIVTVVLAVMGILPLSGIADHWGGLVVAANGHLVPSATKDRRFSGMYALYRTELNTNSFPGPSFHDLLSGIELNPRIGSRWDTKLYQIGLVGMNSWVLIDLSFAAMQYKKYGAVTSTMLVLIALHAIYTVDFFVNEDWSATQVLSKLYSY
ncbi:ergosterol biosynthesis ERG4/ERG24 [Penicillium herquei]|nr:ergosterol biosynthesis ERG4/ERG24 [Penicillium herquei]